MTKDIRKILASEKSKLSIETPKEEDHPALLHNYRDGEFFIVDIDKITPDPHQPRQYFDPDSLDELSQSIRQKGILQPVIIRQEQDKFYLVAGERRYRAAKLAELTQIPAIMTTGNPAEIALIENIQREDLNPIEEAVALNRMIEEYKYTQEKLATVIGKDRTVITTTLSLNKLPQVIKEECGRAHIYPKRVLIEIAKQKTPEKMIFLFNQIKEGNLKSDDVRKITRTPKSDTRTPAGIALGKTIGLVKNLNRLDLDATTENEKLLLITELQNLHNVIEEIIT